MKNWVIFWILAAIWGSSFLLIKIAVDDFGPLLLVSIRLVLASLMLLAFLRLTGRSLPRSRRELGLLMFVGVINTALPFTLITWGEQDIDSGLATVLNATTPLFTLVFAHFVLSDERITPQKVLGLAVGFAGVVVLTSRDVDSSSPNPLSGQLAVLGAAACYGISMVTIRRYLRKMDPFVIAGGSLTFGAIAITVVSLVAASLPARSDLTTEGVIAVLILALANTGIAYFLYYYLIAEWGATQTSLVTYALPPLGLTLGAVLLDETVDWRIALGAALILGGILVVNLHKRKPAPTPETKATSPLASNQ